MAHAQLTKLRLYVLLAIKMLSWDNFETKGMPDESQAAAEKAKNLSLAEFLESSPPDTQLHVDLVAFTYDLSLDMSKADIHLPCNSEKWDGKGNLAFLKTNGATHLDRQNCRFTFETYLCRNCRKTTKTFALAVKVDAKGNSGDVLKLGELPAFGPQVPARVISLIGPDRDTFLRGRRAENLGLGVGAFAYYRRVVENQKGRIIQEMAKVAKKLETSEADLKLFAGAANETQFSTAVEKIKTAIPSALLMSGHNPLTLLHKALSDGLHERSDEECLECAREIRLVLTELAERMSQVLKEESELKEAVSKLLARAAIKKSAEPSGK